jgi:hypothetical protein
LITVRWGIALKIGLPKLRLSRKLLFITLGVTVLLGGSGATAFYFVGGKSLMVEGGESAIGVECIDVQTMVVKTPSNRLRLRKFIRMENASGHERIRTALRISGILAKNNAVDLIHISVLDTHGPTKRADMRARAIGAEVLIALKPDNLPDMKAPAMASYYEGPVSDEGRFYGDKVVVDIDEIGAMMTAMRTVEEKPDCTKPTVEADAEAKTDGHGKTDKKDGHSTPKEGEKAANDHGEKPANDHGEKPANDHGEEPAKDGADKAAEHAEPAKEQSFVDSMLSMVGLGGSDETAAETHEPVAETPADASTDGHGKTDAAEGHDKAPADGEGHDTSDAKPDPASENHAAPDNHEAVGEEPADATSDGHDAAKTDEGHKEVPATETHEPVAEAPAEASTDGHGDTDAAEGHDQAPADSKGHDSSDAKPDPAAENHAAPESHEAVAEEPADASVDGHDAAKTDEGHKEVPAADKDHKAEPVAEEHVAPAKDAHAAEKDPAAETVDHGETPAKVDAHAPAETKEHDKAKKPEADKHAEAYMPVGD